MIEYIACGGIIAIPLIALAVLISRILIGNINSLDFTLFVIGAIPVVVFLPSVFSSSKSGALHTPKVVFRKVETLERRGHKDGRSGKESSNFFSPVSMVLAGLITWLVGYLL